MSEKSILRIAYTTTFDAKDVLNWSGTPFYMSKGFQDHHIDVHRIGPLARKLPRFFKVKQIFKKYTSGQRDSPRFNIYAAKNYSQQVADQLNFLSVDVIVSPLVNPIAFLESKKPIVLWTDALYAALIGFYSPFSQHSKNSVAQGNIVTRECLSRCKLAIFSSDWAANSAIELYGTQREKVKVVPFGANIDSSPNWEEIKQIVAKRNKNKIKLLFLAKSWERKGGDIVLAVAKALHQSGHAIELNIVGYSPPNLNSIPSYINCLGFISKNTAEGKLKIQQLLMDTHFLFVPSRAEAYGIVFCEANAFAVPCLTTYVGGIGTVVKDNLNGKTFGLDTPIDTYCDYIVNVTQQPKAYEQLALSSFHEYQSRLNWKVATANVKHMIEQLI